MGSIALRWPSCHPRLSYADEDETVDRRRPVRSLLARVANSHQHRWAAVVSLFIVAAGCASLRLIDDQPKTPRGSAPRLAIRQAPSGALEVVRPGTPTPVLVQVAKADERPYLHPIAAPDGRGTLTENSPAHHPHQSGLYWGFTRLNGRDYFHNRTGDYWRRGCGSSRGRSVA